MNMEYSIGIPVRNEEKTLAHCVSAALSQDPPAYEILICLNGSNQATYDEAKKTTLHPNVRVLESAPGKPRAWNTIVQNSKTNLIYFTDGDALLQPGAAQCSLSALENTPEAAVTGGDLIYFMPPRPTLWLQLFKSRFNKRVKSRNLSGANYMISRDQFLSLGERIQIPILPADLIHEDIFIGTLARSHKVFVKNDSLAGIFPYATLREYFQSHLRYKRSMQQLEDKFPNYFVNGKPLVQLPPVPSSRGLLSAVRWGISSSVDSYILLTGNDQPQQWTELHSTKPDLREIPRIALSRDYSA